MNKHNYDGDRMNRFGSALYYAAAGFVSLIAAANAPTGLPLCAFALATVGFVGASVSVCLEGLLK